jgi:tetratricopeptide (TPR) repeat protein
MTKRLSPYLRRCATASVLLWICWPDSTAGAQGTQPARSADEVKILYENADYKGALTRAAALMTSALTPQDTREIHLYEALCELALGNRLQAEAKLESILQDDPLYQPPAEMPNRLRLVIGEVRARVAPALAQTHYRNGKTHFDAKDCASALTEFALVLELVPADAEDTPQHLADVRTLATGFSGLCKETLAAAAPASPPPPSAAPPSAPSPSAPIATVATIVPPVAIRRDLPTWPATLNAMRPPGGETWSGIVEVAVTKTGRVDDAHLIKGIHPVYDRKSRCPVALRYPGHRRGE